MRRRRSRRPSRADDHAGSRRRRLELRPDLAPSRRAASPAGDGPARYSAWHRDALAPRLPRSRHRRPIHSLAWSSSPWQNRALFTGRMPILLARHSTASTGPQVESPETPGCPRSSRLYQRTNSRCFCRMCILGTWAEICVGLLARAERPRQPDPRGRDRRHVAGDDKEAPLLDSRGLEQRVEELRRRPYSASLPLCATSPVAKIRSTCRPRRAILRHRPHQSTQDDIPVVRVAALEMKIGDVEPTDLHFHLPTIATRMGLQRGAQPIDRAKSASGRRTD